MNDATAAMVLTTLSLPFGTQRSTTAPSRGMNVIRLRICASTKLTEDLLRSESFHQEDDEHTACQHEHVMIELSGLEPADERPAPDGRRRNPVHRAVDDGVVELADEEGRPD